MSVKSLSKNASKLTLRRRFALQLGGIAAVSVVLFFIFTRYSLGVTENEFEQRALLLAQMLGDASVFNMIMQDEEGLLESLTPVIDSETVLAGAFFTAEGALIAEVQFSDRLAEDDRAVDKTLRWAETTDKKAVLVAVAEIVNEETDEQLGHVIVAVPAASIRAQQRTSLFIAVAILAIIATLAWVMLRVVGRSVVGPVEALRKAAGAVENGDLTARVEINQQDEIGQLAASFNAMVEASERNTRAMQEQREAAETA